MVLSGIKKALSHKLAGAGLAVIIILAAAIRVGELHTYGPTPGDDISYLNAVRESYEGLRQAVPEPSFWFRLSRPFLVANRLTQKTYPEMMAFTSLAKPLYVLKLAVIEEVLGLNLYWEQFTLAVVGTLTIILIYSIGFRLFGSGAGLIAAFLAAISPWLVRYSTYGVPTADSLFWLLLALRLLISHRHRLFLTGLILSIAIMFNPTVIFPAIIIVVIAVIKWWLRWLESRRIFEKPGRALAGGWLRLFAGLIAVPAIWEIANWRYWLLGGLPFRSFWTALAETRADNLDHARMLPVDPVFWLRLVKAGEGWPQLILWAAALVWLVVMIAKKKRRDRFPLVAVTAVALGIIISATWMGTTQCARHYILAWAIGLVAIGGMLAPALKSPRFFGRVGVAIILGVCLLSTIPRLVRYRYSRQGWYRLSSWISENVPTERIVTPANQPPNMWPEVPRFNNWEELETLESSRGPTYIVYGDYLGITRGIWDYPYDMAPIAFACRQVEDEVFRAGTHLSDPAFLYENEDYYWGFARQKNKSFDPDVRVIPTAEVLAFRDDAPEPEDALVAPWEHPDGEEGYNVYLPFVDFSIHPYRSAWWGIGLLSGLFALCIWACWPKSPVLYLWLRGHYVAAGLITILIAGWVFRAYGLAGFSQMGGDDVEYRFFIERARNYPDFAGTGPFKPFIMAGQLSQLDVNKTITSFAKPLFLLERSLLVPVLGESFFAIHFWSCLQGVATILLIFFIGRSLGGVSAGLVASAIWALSPWAVTYSTWGIHVAGGILCFSLAIWAYLRFRSGPSSKRALVAGLMLGISFLYSSSNLWPCFCLFLIDLAARLSQFRRKKSERRALVGHWFLLILGIVLLWLSWELLSWSSSRLAGGQYLSFPLLLLNTVRDNILHARALSVDPLFFWRHLFVSEGILVGAGIIAGLLFSLWMVLRRRAPEEVAVLLALGFGITVTMNYTGGSQVIRHYFPAWLPLTLLTGWAVSRLLKKRPRMRWVVAGVLVVLVFTQWLRLDLFRRARWAPELVRLWAKGHLFVPGRVSTLACQNMDLWPGLVPVRDWEDLRQGRELQPPGVMMYSDYIEIAHGSWFYSFPQYYEISEVARHSQGDLFRTPSYLSYQPSLFENEFYYWGLFRKLFLDFDPAIRILPAGKLVKNWDEIRSSPRRLEEFWAPAKKEPPLMLPARPNDIARPFMEARPRPSYKAHLIITLLGLLGLAWWGQCFPLKREEVINQGGG